VAVVAEAPASAKPVRLMSSGKAYLRFGDGDYQLPGVEEEAFVFARARPNFDEAAVPDAHRDDRDPILVAQFREQARAEASGFESSTTMTSS
jgi:predicted HTH transcriptional regulator